MIAYKNSLEIVDQFLLFQNGFDRPGLNRRRLRDVMRVFRHVLMRSLVALVSSVAGNSVADTSEDQDDCSDWKHDGNLLNWPSLTQSENAMEST